MIRHGQTPWNVERRLQGRSDTDLNEIGREMAIETGKAFQKVHFDVVFTSPLKRARETAELFLGDRKVPVIEEPRIQEISFGDYEGLTCGKDNYSIPDPNFNDFFEHPEHYQTPPNGESLEELGARTKSFYGGYHAPAGASGQNCSGIQPRLRHPGNLKQHPEF